MILTQTPQHKAPVDPWMQDSCEVCRRLIAEAEREMGAFVSAVKEIFGSKAAARAAEYWVELAETMSPPVLESHPNWRKFTIMASNRLAGEGTFGENLLGTKWEVTAKGAILESDPVLVSAFTGLPKPSEAPLIHRAAMRPFRFP